MFLLRRLIIGLAIVSSALVGVAPASATVEHFSFPIEETNIVHCSGEEVLITGEFRGVFSSHTDAAGNYHQHITQNLHDGRATVVTNPDIVYRVHQTESATWLLDSDGPHESATAILTALWHVPGPERSDFWGRNRFHITITPDGELTAQKLSFEFGCRPETEPAP